MPRPSAAAVVTPVRTVDRPALSRLAECIQSPLATALTAGVPLGIWVEDPVDFTASIMAALAANARAFIILPGASATQAAEASEREGGSAILCDASRAIQLTRGKRVRCGPGLVLVETSTGDTEAVPGAGAVHFSTSGTDGRPKVVVRTRQSLELEEATVGGHLDMKPGCAVLCAVPVTHGYGFTAGLFAPLRLGGTAIVARPRLAASLADLLRMHEPDIVVAVPAQYAAWSALRGTYDGPLPRLWICGGAPLPAAVRDKFQTAWGGVIAEQYGMTECGAVSVDLEGAETLGRPYPGVTITVDGDGSAEQVGEVVVATPYGPRGYLGDPADGSASQFTPHGFRSGDAGWLDADGRLHLVGRRAHQLNVHGRQVDPTEVERAFWALDGVHDVAVVGVDRAAGDQWVAAFVVCAASLTDDTLHQATSHLESFKRPQRVIRPAELPKTATGVDLEALRALLR